MHNYEIMHICEYSLIREAYHKDITLWCENNKMYAQNLPPSRKLGVWEISPMLSLIWRWPSFKLEVGFKL